MRRMLESEIKQMELYLPMSSDMKYNSNSKSCGTCVAPQGMELEIGTKMNVGDLSSDNGTKLNCLLKCVSHFAQDGLYD